MPLWPLLLFVLCRTVIRVASLDQFLYRALPCETLYKVRRIIDCIKPVRSAAGKSDVLESRFTEVPIAKGGPNFCQEQTMRRTQRGRSEVPVIVKGAVRTSASVGCPPPTTTWYWPGCTARTPCLSTRLSWRALSENWMCRVSP